MPESSGKYDRYSCLSVSGTAILQKGTEFQMYLWKRQITEANWKHDLQAVDFSGALTDRQECLSYFKPCSAWLA